MLLFALTASALIGLDLTNWAPQGVGPLVALISIFVLIAEAWIVRGRVRRHGWLGALPLLAVILVLPSGSLSGRAFITLRFQLAKQHYERVAASVIDGSYPGELHGQDRTRASWMKPISDGGDGKPVGVQFMVISYGFAGHVGFVRFRDDATSELLLAQRPPQGWHAWGYPVGALWYTVHN